MRSQIWAIPILRSDQQTYSMASRRSFHLQHNFVLLVASLSMRVG